MFKRIVLSSFFVLVFAITGIVFGVGEDLSSLPGDLVMVGEDYNVYTFNFATNSETQLTDDATNRRRYQWPTWSTDGRLAYFCCDLSRARDFRTQVYISGDSVTAGEIVFEAEGASVIYAAWSPGNCSDGANCRDLALLVNDVMRGGLSVEMVRNRTDVTTSRRIGEGSPFYYQWNGSGSQLLIHRNNRSLDIYDLAMEDVTTNFAEPSSGAFQTPSWSPIDDRVLYGAAGEERGTTTIVVNDGVESRALVSNISGLVSFMWSPDGRYVAYRSLDNGSVSPLIVLDVESGEVITQTDSVGILSFFWAPDSRRIAFVTLGGRGQSTARVSNSLDQRQQPVQDLPTAFWSVLDLASEIETQLVEFAPTYEMGYLIQYFDQFAPSHRIWSPDSRHLVYSELVIEGEVLRPNVNIVDVENATSTRVANGVFGIWSFE